MEGLKNNIESISSSHAITMTNLSESLDSYGRKPLGANRFFSCCCSFSHRLSITLVVSSIFVGIGVINPITGPTIGTMSEYLDENESDTSLIFTMKSIGMVSGSIILALIGDFALHPKIQFLSSNLHQLLVVSVWLMALPIILIPFIPWLWGNLIFHFFVGVGIGSCIIVGFMLPGVVWEGNMKTMVLHFFNFCFGIGAFTYPFFIGGILSAKLEPQPTLIITYCTAGMLGLLPTILICIPYFIENNSDKISVNDRPNDRSPTEEVHELLEEEEEVVEEKKASPKIFCKVTTYLRILFIFLSCIVVFLYISLEGVFWGVNFIFCVESGLDESVASIMNSLFFISFTIGRFMGIFGSQLMSPIQIAFIVCIGLVGTMIFYIFLILKDYNWVIYVCTILSGWFCSTWMPNFFVIPDYFGIKITGFENSLILGSSYCGFAMPTATVVLMTTYGKDMFLYCGLLFSVLLLLFWYCQYATGHLFQYFAKKEIVDRIK